MKLWTLSYNIMLEYCILLVFQMEDITFYLTKLLMINRCNFSRNQFYHKASWEFEFFTLSQLINHFILNLYQLTSLNFLKIVLKKISCSLLVYMWKKLLIIYLFPYKPYSLICFSLIFGFCLDVIYLIYC